jgi:hypothetical protein
MVDLMKKDTRHVVKLTPSLFDEQLCLITFMTSRYTATATRVKSFLLCYSMIHDM